MPIHGPSLLFSSWLRYSIIFASLTLFSLSIYLLFEAVSFYIARAAWNSHSSFLSPPSAGIRVCSTTPSLSIHSFFKESLLAFYWERDTVILEEGQRLGSCVCSLWSWVGHLGTLELERLEFANCTMVARFLSSPH